MTADKGALHLQPVLQNNCWELQATYVYAPSSSSFRDAICHQKLLQDVRLHGAICLGDCCSILHGRQPGRGNGFLLKNLCGLKWSPKRALLLRCGKGCLQDLSIILLIILGKNSTLCGVSSTEWLLGLQCNSSMQASESHTEACPDRTLFGFQIQSITHVFNTRKKISEPPSHCKFYRIFC